MDSTRGTSVEVSRSETLSNRNELSRFKMYLIDKNYVILIIVLTKIKALKTPLRAFIVHHYRSSTALFNMASLTSM